MIQFPVPSWPSLTIAGHLGTNESPLNLYIITGTTNNVTKENYPWMATKDGHWITAGNGYWGRWRLKMVAEDGRWIPVG